MLNKAILHRPAKKTAGLDLTSFGRKWRRYALPHI